MKNIQNDINDTKSNAERINDRKQEVSVAVKKIFDKAIAEVNMLYSNTESEIDKVISQEKRHFAEATHKAVSHRRKTKILHGRHQNADPMKHECE